MVKLTVSLFISDIFFQFIRRIFGRQYIVDRETSKNHLTVQIILFDKFFYNFYISFVSISILLQISFKFSSYIDIISYNYYFTLRFLLSKWFVVSFKTMTDIYSECSPLLSYSHMFSIIITPLIIPLAYSLFNFKKC